MRAVISLSTTREEARRTRRRARDRGFGSVSEYLRFLMRQDEGPLIGEEELLTRAARSDKLEEAGKLIKAKSLAEFVDAV